MTNVISIDKKLKLTNEKKNALLKKQKLLAVQKLFQCTHCAYKCEKCGTQINFNPQNQKENEQNLLIPYRFCDGCSKEYVDYLKLLKGQQNAECFWHNEEWRQVWKTWINYHSAINLYLRSKEFVRLLNEVKQSIKD